ncbi:hypothetical protein PHYBOEH_011929 [Phytophthora boehmeriae]|uniref:Peptidase S1 domain-containing protein n=1 Tax=Phytophthora boehmeriae TaxID=109152 RepID=A0A8T1VH84_9STRA|nr:hypothetical protein PHYBOEH_011929 [Phytophthora boehmeriae]
MKLSSTLTVVGGTALALCLSPTHAQARSDGSNYSNVSVSDLVPGNISTDAIGTSLKSNTSTVPIGAKTYIAGLRPTIDGNNACTASLITPTHILAATFGNIRWASIGSHYPNGTQDGEQIKVVAIFQHPESTPNNFTNDFTIMTLEKPSSFKPVALAAPDDSDIKDGEWAVKFG